MMQLRLEHKVRMPNGTYMLVDDIERPQLILSRDEMYERLYQTQMLYDSIDRTISQSIVAGKISEKGLVVAHTNQ